MQFFTLQIEQLAGSRSVLHRISEIGQPHKPHRMLGVFLTSDLKSDPARVGNPAVRAPCFCGGSSSGGSYRLNHPSYACTDLTTCSENSHVTKLDLFMVGRSL